MPRRTAILLTFVAVLTALLQAARPSPPKLVVLIVVDQMRADYIDDFSKDWVAGLKRLVANGAWFQRAMYPYLATWTCPGHATVSTGTLPHRHGIIENSWFDRETASMVTCTADPAAHNLGLTAGQLASGKDSAAKLWSPTLGDELRAQKNAHIAGLSLKARSAIMLTGHGGDSAIWLNDALDGWETSSEYGAPPPTARAFVEANSMDSDYGKTWTRMLPNASYLHEDDGLAENPPPGWTSTFPHVLTSKSGHPDSEYRTQWERSPFADDYLGRFAAAMADGLGLGKHQTTDLLSLSFSTPDLVGHRFGPRSQEIQDVYAHLDRTIGILLDHLDATVGRDQYVVALTADHGIPAIPEQLVKDGVDAGRLAARSMTAVIEKAVSTVLGPGEYVARENSGEVYFKPSVYDRLTMKPGGIEAVVATIAKQPGVERVFRGEQLRDATKTTDWLLRAASLSYVQERSGDLLIAAKAGWRFSPNGTTHGTANPDDQHVPIVLMGRGIKHGVYKQAATPADVAPTLAALAGVLMPHAEGRVLREALAQ